MWHDFICVVLHVWICSIDIAGLTAKCICILLSYLILLCYALADNSVSVTLFRWFIVFTVHVYHTVSGWLGKSPIFLFFSGVKIQGWVIWVYRVTATSLWIKFSKCLLLARWPFFFFTIWFLRWSYHLVLLLFQAQFWDHNYILRCLGRRLSCRLFCIDLHRRSCKYFSCQYFRGVRK